MRVVKKILLGSLELEPETGKIWLCDLTGCVLRISKLDFKNNLEKFDMIDISENKVYMTKNGVDQIISDEVIGKLEEVINLLLLKVSQESKPKEFLKEVFDIVNKFILETKK